MVQALLTERFQLKVHLEERQGSEPIPASISLDATGFNRYVGRYRSDSGDGMPRASLSASDL
jgi:hypothetical protein